jgi:hypothetical protein
VYGSSRVNGHLRAFPKIAGDSMRHVCDVDSPILSRVRSGFQQCGNAGGRPIAIMADVHYMREATMRLVVCVTMCSMPILANAAQIDAQAPSDPQAYCVNRSADFYPYRGEPCKSGYQLGSGNCRKTDGRMVAVPKEQCAAMPAQSNCRLKAEDVLKFQNHDRGRRGAPLPYVARMSFA